MLAFEWDTWEVKTYAQYCPIARASEILAQRWTPIIVRNLLAGASTYNRLADGAPGIPRSLLTSRLRELVSAGLVEKSGDAGEYHLTEAGEDLARVLDAMGQWGERWLDVTPDHANPIYMLNAWVNTYLNRDALPVRRVVVRFQFRDQPPKVNPMWVIFNREDSEVCRQSPGFDDDLVVDAESVAIAEWHLGRVEWNRAVAAGRISVEGPRALATALPTWNRRSVWAS